MELIDTTPPRTLPPRLVLLLASFSALLSSLDSSVNIAFPAISAAFALDVPAMQWIVISYVLTYASLLLGCGRFADVWGHQRVLTWGLLLSAIAFLGCGFAATFPCFLTARVLQGIGDRVSPCRCSGPNHPLGCPRKTGPGARDFPDECGDRFRVGTTARWSAGRHLQLAAVYLFRIFPAVVLAVLSVQSYRSPTRTKGTPVF